MQAHPESRASAVCAWFNRRCSWTERSGTKGRPAGGRASSDNKRCAEWQRYGPLFCDDRCVDRRKRSGLRAACQGQEPFERSQLWSVETATVLGSATRRSVLRKNRRLPGAGIISEWQACRLYLDREAADTAASTVHLHFPRNKSTGFRTVQSMNGRNLSKQVHQSPQKGNHRMFSIKELRKKQQNQPAYFIVRGPDRGNGRAPHNGPRLAHRRGRTQAQTNPNPSPTATPRPDPHAPGNFRVTALGTCTVSVAWDPVNFTLEDFNYYLSGTNQAPPAVLPRTATSHTFTGLGAANEYWFFIYARDVSGRPSGQSAASDQNAFRYESANDRAGGLSHGGWIQLRFHRLDSSRGRRVLVVLRGLGERQSLCPDRETSWHTRSGSCSRRRPIQSRSGATTQGISRGLSPIPFRSRPCRPIPTTTPRRTPRLTCKRSVTATLSSSCGGPNPPMTSIGRRIFATTFT